MIGRMTDAQKDAARGIVREMLASAPGTWGRDFAHTWVEKAPYDRLVRKATGKWRIIRAAQRLARIAARHGGAS